MTPPVPLPVALNLDKIERGCRAAIARAGYRGTRRAEVRLDAETQVLPLLAEVRRLQAEIERLRVLMQNVEDPDDSAAADEEATA